ncbi:hypothetical protein OSB04_007517 [Centaurea solstitialis]|uniref:Kinesin motor domain-containing protein n=1 Tax=Centaurea solstitialis TaxID=347529 RepID=A0AA38WIJ8_9ASTR|nr:hypothetical protein OSB04_007517 [Centaurea solstitialis]
MENSPESCNVKVALHIRPLLKQERSKGGVECLDVVPGTSQVLMGSHSFIFDHIYGGGGSPSSNMFDDCVAPLLDALFQGYNGTVIAYGQTGSGKTYTMGTAPKEGGHRGLIFEIMNTIFNKIEALKDQIEFQLHCSYIEILKEEVRDLLDSAVIDRIENSDGHAENAVPGKMPVQIRKASDGAVSLSGSTEISISTQKEMIACLEQGCANRSTASTDMNSQSSRSHAIFSIILEQKDKNKGEANSNDNFGGEEYKCAKLHMVDLAGSERAKRAGSEGVRLKEGIQINKGLLALGNVISALGDDKKRKEGLHIPYRDSKLTRLLQASLGGNCKTVMIACVSPADFNAEETLNTLKYANRARNIQNKASVQKEVFPADTHKLRQQLRLMQAELAHRREAEIVEVQELKRKIDSAEATNSELLQKIQEYRATNSELFQKIHEYRTKCAAYEKDAHEYRLYFAQRDGVNRDSQCTTSPETITESVATRDIEGKVVKEPDKLTIKQEHDIRQDMWNKELNDMNRLLEKKESEMKLLGSPDVEALKQRFGRKIMELEEGKRLLQLERDGLRAEIARLEDMGGPTEKEQTMNAEKLEEIEVQIAELEKQHEQQIELLKQKNHDAMKRLQEQISLIKSQKVQLQQKMKHEEEQFRQWKSNSEKQMLQLKKEGRKSEFERHKLLALYQRQTQVLQRKTEEAARATKKLKELLELRKVANRKETAGKYLNGTSFYNLFFAFSNFILFSSLFQLNPVDKNEVIKNLTKWLNHELDKATHVNKLQMQYEKQTNHAKLKEELMFLKQMDKPSSHSSRPPPEDNKQSRTSSLSPNTRAARMTSLETKMKSSSAAISLLSSQLQEAGRGHDLASGRWKMINLLGDAKDLLQYLFNLVTDTRRRLLEKEVEMKEMKAQLDELMLQQKETLQQKEIIREASTQTTSTQNAKGSTITKKSKEIEDQTVQSTKVKENTKDTKEKENTKDTRENENRKEKENTKDTRVNTKDTRDKENTKDTRVKENTKDTRVKENTKDTRVKENTRDMENARDTRDKENTRDTRDKENTRDTSERENTGDTSERENTGDTSEKENIKDTKEKPNTEGNPPAEESQEMEWQAITIPPNPPPKAKPITPFDIFADLGIESPLPFPESRILDSRAGICNRPIQEVFIQTQKMVPIAHVCMKKLPLGEQKGRVSRWRRSHDEWLIQFKWKWQKPWKLSQLIRIGDEIRNSDETLKDLSIKVDPAT